VSLRGAGLAAALVLAGCATAPPPPAEGELLAGRLSVQVAASDAQPARQLSGGFELRGSATQGQLDLISPLGTLVARARWRPGQAELDGPDGNARFADLSALSAQAFGEPMPLAALFDWLRGRPWPEAPSQALASAPGFEQLGWQVETGQHAAGQIVARRLAAPVVTLRARLEAAP
jgi:outer membrane lipoprotein LolB